MKFDFPETAKQTFDLCDADHLHSMCFACSPKNPTGLFLNFELVNARCVRAEFKPSEIHQGYQGYVHGGLVATILDSAMTRLLFCVGIVAVTAELKIRYRNPMRIGMSAHVYADLLEHHHPVYTASAEVHQCDAMVASAQARFMIPEDVRIQYPSMGLTEGALA